MNKSLTVLLTENATKHFSKLLKENQALLIGLKKSGCAGFAYTLEVHNLENHNPDLRQFCIQNVSFLIKENDIAAFDNCIIDYKREGLNYRLTFDNPNAYNECGCGESFALTK